MAEWLKARAWKARISKGIVGSNPTLSENKGEIMKITRRVHGCPDCGASRSEAEASIFTICMECMRRIKEAMSENKRTIGNGIKRSWPNRDG